MTLTAAAGDISKAEDALAIMIADSTSWRTACGAANQAQALARIHFDAIPEPDTPTYTLAELQALRPYWVIASAVEEGITWVHDATGGGGYELGDVSGEIRGMMVMDVPTADPLDIPAEVMRVFKNLIGNIVNDLRVMAGAAGRLAVNKITLVSGPHRQPDRQSEQGDVLWCELAFHWR